jgi:hypothetical protein
VRQPGIPPPLPRYVSGKMVDFCIYYEINAHGDDDNEEEEQRLRRQNQ